jgi:large subunit ribosomal protein L30
MTSTLTVRLVKSPIGYPRDQRATVRSLGLRRMNAEVQLSDSESVRGMLKKVRHLVRVQEDGGAA